MFSYLQKAIFGSEEQNSIESSDENTIMAENHNHENGNGENSHFTVGEDNDYQNEDSDQFNQDAPKTPNYVLGLEEKRKRLRYVTSSISIYITVFMIG